MMKPILVVPSYKAGRGGGHLARCAALVEELRSLGRETRLYTPETPLAVPEGGFAFIALDCFRTSPADFFAWRRLAPVVGVDEGGPCRNAADFLIDLLPNLEKTPPNICKPGLLRLLATRRPAWDAPLVDGVARRASRGAETGARKPARVLIAFGAEDAEGLTAPAAAALAAKNELEVAAIFGALNRSAPPRLRARLREKNVTVLEHVPNLGERLAEYDLVITHFGLTAFESLHARVPVILVSPTAYHEKLARNAGFFTAGRGMKGIRRLKKLELAGEPLAALRRRCREIAEWNGIESAEPSVKPSAGGSVGPSTDGPAGKSLAHVLNAIVIHAADCPICGDIGGPRRFSLARFYDRTYRACPVCGITYMSRSSPPPIEYAKDYFFDFYKKQYGKTYIEDFPNLARAGRRRLSHIVSIMKTRDAPLPGRGKPQLLDIGCAYGPFLAAAREEGFAPAGVEAAEDAASYVQRELGMPCFRGHFPPSRDNAPFSDGQFDVISLWYVIEHFENAGAALAAINKLLKKGGVLAFSTPSLEGVSARGSPQAPRSFLEKSPPDHYTVWSPSKTRGVLRRFGFDLKKIVVTGHHPERFPLLGKLVAGENGILRGAARRVLLAASRSLGLGDTFEAYAVKM